MEIRNNVLDNINPDRVKAFKKLGRFFYSEDDIWRVIDELESYIQLGSKYGKGIKFLVGEDVYYKILDKISLRTISITKMRTIKIKEYDLQLNFNIEPKYILAYALDCEYNEKSLEFDTGLLIKVV